MQLLSGESHKHFKQSEIRRIDFERFGENLSLCMSIGSAVRSEQTIEICTVLCFAAIDQRCASNRSSEEKVKQNSERSKQRQCHRWFLELVAKFVLFRFGVEQ